MMFERTDKAPGTPVRAAKRLTGAVLFIVFLLAACALLTLLPARAQAASNPTVSGSTIYANGTTLFITGSDDTHTTVYIDSNSNGVFDSGTDKSLASTGISGAPADDSDLTYYIIYGGGNSAAVSGDTNITVLGGKVNKLYGGGSGSTVGGSTHVTISGGRVETVCGGGNGNGSTVDGSTYVAVSDGSVTYVYGGGYNGTAPVTGDTHVTVTGGTVSGELCGGSIGSTVDGKTHVTVTGGTVSGELCGTNYGTVGSTEVTIGGGASVKSVYGANSTVNGDTHVTVSGNATVNGSVFGCGKGTVGSAAVEITGGTVSYSVFGGGGGTVGSAAVNITGGTVSGSVYGGGSGTVTGAATVNITGGTVSDSVFGGGAPGYSGSYPDITIVFGTVGSSSVTVGGSAKIGGADTGANSAPAGVAINGGTSASPVANGVDSFVIGGDLTGDVYVLLPEGYGVSDKPVIATGAAADDLGHVRLTGAGAAENMAYTSAGNIKVKPIPAPTVSNKNIYANGVPLILTAGSSNADYTVIYIDSDNDGDISNDKIFNPGSDATAAGNDLSDYDIYSGGNSDETLDGDLRLTMRGGKVDYIFGGCHSGAVNGDTHVTISGGTVTGKVWGGSNNTNGTVSGTATVNVTGGTVRSVYGGGGGAVGNAAVTISGGAVKIVYGGGFGGTVTGTATVNITGGTVSGDFGYSVYGGGDHCGVGRSSVNISGGTVCGTVCGGSDYSTVGGDANVTISGNAQVTGDVYGGGYSFNTSSSTVLGDTYVTVTGGTVTGSVFGGGYTKAAVNGKASVTVIGGTVTGFVGGGGDTAAATVGRGSSVTVGGSASIGSEGYEDGDGVGVAINGGSMTYGVDSFKIDPDLTGNVYVVLPEGYDVSSNPVIATSAVAADLGHIRLTGYGNSENTAAYLDGPDIRIHKHSWSTTWSRDGSYHWHNCTAVNGCPVTDNSQKAGYGAHSLSYSANGSAITQSCAACGHSATATITAGSKAYDGDKADATISYSNWLGDQASSVTHDPNNANAGGHTASFTIGGATASVSYTISQAEVESPAIASKVYTGGTLTAQVPASDLYTVTANDGGQSVGKYDVVLTLNDAVNYKWKGGGSDPLTLKFSITKATNEWTTTPAISGWTYGTTASEPAYAAKFGDVTVEYKPKTANDSAYSADKPSNAGDYTARFTAAGTGDYTALSATVDFTIALADISVSSSGVNAVYDGATHDITVTAQPGDAKVEYSLTNSGGDWSETRPTFKDVAGGTTVYYRVTKDNYKTVTGSVTVTIAQRPATLTWSGHGNLVYTGKPVNVSATVTNLADGDECAATVTGGTETAAGTYTATATALSNGNYKLQNGTTQSYAIAKATVSFEVTDNEYGYDAAAHTATVTPDCATYTLKAADYAVTYGGAANRTNNGQYDIEVELKNPSLKHANSDNAKLKVGTLTITQAAYPEQEKITWPTAAGVTYGQTLSESALSDGATTSSGGDGAFTWTDGAAIPTVANDGYSVTFTPDDTNYDPITETVSISVTPKELTITGASAETRQYAPEDTDVMVSGGNLAGVVTRGGVPDNVVLDKSNAAGTVETADADNGKPVTVTGYALTGGDAGNYTLEQPDYVTVNITKSDAGSGSVTMEDWTYDSTAQKSPVPVSESNGTDNVTYRYAGTKLNGDPYDSEDAPADAGTYGVTATFAETNNYEEFTLPSVEFTVARKAIMVQWTKASRTYDGTAQSPVLTPVGVETGDQSGVSAELTGGGKTNAGSYPVAAELTGERAFNYTLTNPAGTLVIQKAPVTFTVSDNTVQHDGMAKTATVTATANGGSFTGFTIAYKTGDGKAALYPADAGSYGVWATLTDANFRHSDSTGGESRKIGVLTIYQSTPPAKYTVSFDQGEGENITGSTAELAEAPSGTLRALPECGFTRPGYAFAGWELDGVLYQPGEPLEQPARKLTLTAEWVEVVHEIGGVVNQNGSPVEHAVVTLTRGARRVAETSTDADGKFVFPNVVPGLYNLTGSFDGVVMTVKAELTTEDLTGLTITLPQGKTNSVVEVLAGTPDIVVGNLEAAFNEGNTEVYTTEDQAVVEQGGTVELKLIAEAVAEDENDSQQAAIQKKEQNVGLYLELSLKKTVTPANTGSTTTDLTTSGDVLLESVITLPAYMQGKYNYSVCRLHDPDGTGPEAPVLDVLTETKNKAGEYIEVSKDKTSITIHAKEYSLYAIACANWPNIDTAYPITVTETEHGTVELSTKRPISGNKVIITPVPDEGYEAGKVTVTDKDGNKLAVTKNSDGTWTFTQPGSSVTVTVTFKPVKAAWNPFTDVKEGAWYYDSVKYVYEHDLMNGTSATTFSPELATTRGMIVTILWRMEGEPDSGTAMAFTDVAAGSYYYDAVLWASGHGIVTGYGDGNFGPEDLISREQLAAILWRYAKYKGMDVSVGEDTNILSYIDFDQISEYAIPAMQWACGAGVLEGKGGGMLDPQGQAARAEAAAVLARFLGKIK